MLEYDLPCGATNGSGGHHVIHFPDREHPAANDSVKARDVHDADRDEDVLDAS